MILPDYLRSGLDVVFCGTAAGNKSAKVRHYYADSTNKFWRILYETRLTRERLTPETDHLITDYHLGLTDLAQRHFGNDRTLRPEMYDVPGFEEKILRLTPRFVAFNGKEAPAVYLGIAKKKISYGRQQKTIGATEIFVLPSTSGLAGNSWNEDVWREFASSMVHAK